MSVVEEPGGLEAHQLGGLELGPGHRERMGDRLVLADRTVEDHALLGVVHGPVQRRTADAHGLDAGEDALGVE
jgi:hypothetical protein